LQTEYKGDQEKNILKFALTSAKLLAKKVMEEL